MRSWNAGQGNNRAVKRIAEATAEWKSDRVVRLPIVNKEVDFCLKGCRDDSWLVIGVSEGQDNALGVSTNLRSHVGGSMKVRGIVACIKDEWQ
ncbi:unnamed protein product [Prunus armeniaca]|uniref:Uncharacterized protein n=1 Tax=Prunus armeniaca TaxID=36596 RepID=A0A6J5VKV6_PRUAR|nr:unnamed protein product [Prunus armeniaca]